MVTELTGMLTRKTTFGALCLFILCGILVAGLWPFHAPKNQVSWLLNENGLRFGDHATIISSAPFKTTRSQDEAACSLEMWLEPGLTYDSNTLLTLYDPENPRKFSLRQSGTNLELRSEGRGLHDRIRDRSLYIGDVFRQGRQLFVTVTSAGGKPAVYIDGILVPTFLPFRLSSKDLTGELIIANSPMQNDSWSGRLRGLAIYKGELTATQVLEHFQAWTQGGRPMIAENERNITLYLFDEHAGSIIHNQVRSGPDLRVPERYVIVHQLLLERPWEEYQPGWGYWESVLINIAGFVPLGFVFCAYLSMIQRVYRPALTTIILGGAVSLTIEVLQAYLPTRCSGMADLIAALSFVLPPPLNSLIGRALPCDSVRIE